MNMKKMYFRLMMAMMGLVAVSLTSCDDEEIAKTLEGTWKGDKGHGKVICTYLLSGMDITITPLIRRLPF